MLAKSRCEPQPERDPVATAPPTDKTISILVFQKKKVFQRFFYDLKNDTQRHYVIDEWTRQQGWQGQAVGRGEGEGNGHWHLFTVFDNCSLASFCWATIWLKGYATLIVPFCGQSQQDRATICLPFSLSNSLSLCLCLQGSHSSPSIIFHVVVLAWLALIASRDLPLPSLPSALSLFICVDAQKG